jgi:hypothetical protein
MDGLLAITLLIILLAPYLGRGKFKEIERQQSMRRVLVKLREKYRHISL